MATRLAAVGGLLLLTPIWVMLWDRGQYLWTYPAEDLFPLLLLMWVLSRWFKARFKVHTTVPSEASGRSKVIDSYVIEQSPGDEPKL